MKRKITACIMTIIILISAIPVSAANENRTNSDHVFTYEELACMTPVDTSDMAIPADGFIPVNHTEGQNTRAMTLYYIALTEDGGLLSSTSNGGLDITWYSDGENNSHRYQKWIFTTNQSGEGTVYPFTNTELCLTADPSTHEVTLSQHRQPDEEGWENQIWKMFYSPVTGAYVLRLVEDGSDICGYDLLINGSSFDVGDIERSYFGFFEVSWYVPCTSVYLDDIHINVGETAFISPTISPSDSSDNSNMWLKYAYIASDKAVVDETLGTVTGVTFGYFSLRVTHKITEVYYIAYVYISSLPDPDAQNKTGWCWAAAAKMVGEHNGGSGSLDTGVAILDDSDDKHSYNGIKFYGVIPGRGDPGTVYTVDAGQRQIVMACWGTDANHMGTDRADRIALELAAYNPVQIELIEDNLIFGGFSNANIEKLNNELSTGRWVYAVMSTDDLNYDHAIVIRSVNSSETVYTYWDPWTNAEGTFTIDDINDKSIVLDSGNSIYEMISFCLCIPTE